MEILGAIIGDICGSVYEWHNETDPNKIELFRDGCRFTDDTVCFGISYYVLWT